VSLSQCLSLCVSVFVSLSLYMCVSECVNPNSYKVRKAKVGGYRDYFDDEQIRAMNERLGERLAPVFGYKPQTETPGEVSNA